MYLDYCLFIEFLMSSPNRDEALCSLMGACVCVGHARSGQSNYLQSISALRT